jgi:hypothetical protein
MYQRCTFEAMASQAALPYFLTNAATTMEARSRLEQNDRRSSSVEERQAGDSSLLSPRSETFRAGRAAARENFKH